MEYFQGMYKQGKDFYNINHVEGLRKYINPDFYCVFPSLKEICREEQNKFWDNYLLRKEEAHNKRGKKFFSGRVAEPTIDDALEKPKRKRVKF